MNEILTREALEQLSHAELTEKQKLLIRDLVAAGCVASYAAGEAALNKIIRWAAATTSRRMVVCNDTDCEVREDCDHAKPHLENEECQYACDALDMTCGACQPVGDRHD